MSRATCRCGQTLQIPPRGVEHIKCPKCSARVRIVRKSSDSGETGGDADGFLRFSCPCGRRLKVDAADRPTHGKCPGCGRVVPVPVGGSSSALDESPTEEMEAVDVAKLKSWARRFPGAGSGSGAGSVHGGNPGSTVTMSPEARNRPAEAGLRVCPRCGKPIHLGSEVCRGCGTAVPKR